MISEKRQGKPSKGILLQQDNARVHTCKIAMDAVEWKGYELIPHPAHSLDLAPSDYFLFPNLKKDIRGRHFRSTKKSWRQLRSGSETRTLASSVLVDGTGTPLVQVHHSRGQLHRRRRDRSHPEIS